MTLRSLRVAVVAVFLLVGSASAASAEQEQAQVRRELRALEVSFDGRIGAYALDVASGRSVRYRAGERFPLLSTFKAPLCAAALHRARTVEPGLMGTVLRWSAKDLLPNSPTTEKHVKDGLTVARLCEAAITVSDNAAANVVLKRLGGPAGLTRYFGTLKDSISRLDRWEPELNDWTRTDKRDTTTPAAIAGDLRLLTLGSTLHPQDRDTFTGWLVAARTGGERIRAGLPVTWKVGDKTGTNSAIGAGNDVAVIWPGKAQAPIIMAIYTHRARGGLDEAVIAKAATIVARGLGRL